MSYFHEHESEPNDHDGLREGSIIWATPVCVTADRQGRIFVLDSRFDDVTQLIYDRENPKTPAVFGMIKHNGKSRVRQLVCGPGKKHLDRPSGVAVDTSGNFIVTDPENKRIVVFDDEGVFVRAFGNETYLLMLEIMKTGIVPPRVKSLEITDVMEPYSVAVSKRDEIVVTDVENNAIVVFDTNGNRLRRVELEGVLKLDQKSGVALDSQDNILVTDVDNCRVVKLSYYGVFIETYGHKGSNSGQLMSPSGVAVDRQDNIIVADTGNSRIVVFDKDRKGLGGISCEIGQGILKSPIGVSVDSSGSFIVSDTTYCTVVALDHMYNFDSRARLFTSTPRFQSQRMHHPQPRFLR
jgi:DNA-binding beta-propeller fold protein YncE